MAAWNPSPSTVDATRQLFGNPGVPGDPAVARHALLLAVLWPLLVVFVPLSVRQFRRLDT